ncbi:MAG: hypothetical protein VKJ24_02390 [Synechococcales bacterium]|nr:hypothetical protein [Synechococcales bacterium]
MELKHRCLAELLPSQQGNAIDAVLNREKANSLGEIAATKLSNWKPLHQDPQHYVACEVSPVGIVD